VIGRHWLAWVPLVAGVVGCGRAAAPAGNAVPAADAPALVVLISVDQLREDLLQRYDRFYTGGFRRLLDQGAVFSGTHDHAVTETAPGHATLATGVVPARSGIVGNDWQELVDRRWVGVYNVSDSLSPIVGEPRLEGMSPRNLKRPGLADWVLTANPGAKVVSIGGKDRSAILLAGQSRGQVYWYNGEAGRFVTSRYYADQYPAWLERFNAQELQSYFDTVWVNTAPAEARALARPDAVPYEGDGVRTTFPHRFREEAGPDGQLSRWVGRTPFVDAAVLGLAAEAVEELGLGRDRIADFLGVGLAQTDYVGHSFGPLSQEQLDNLLRLDRELGEFFTALDRMVGPGRWVAALSADHGVVTMPEWLAAQGEPGHRVTPSERERFVQLARQAAETAPRGRVAKAVASAVETLPWVADALTFEELARTAPQDSFARLYRNSYFPGRATGDLGPLGVEVRLTEGTYMGARTGTGHGSPYLYDRSVPVIFLGHGVRPAPAAGSARTVDVAPTLARLAGVRVPRDLDGRPLRLEAAP
jgi:hypothetical protein